MMLFKLQVDTWIPQGFTFVILCANYIYAKRIINLLDWDLIF